MKTRNAVRRRRQSFTPVLLGLERRTMMAAEIGSSATQFGRVHSPIDATVFLSEATALLVGEPLPDRLRDQLNQGLQNGSISREDAFARILQTPQYRTRLVEDLTRDLLDRDPTAAESRRLVARMGAHGVDVPWVMLRIMGQPEYFRTQGGNGAAFVQGVTNDLLHREATPDELASLAGRSGAPARLRFLRNVLASEEFVQTSTSDAAARYIGGSISTDDVATLRHSYQGPQGHTSMLASVLGTASADVGGVVPTYENHAGLAIKRVPGFFAGSITIPNAKEALPPNLAAPFDLFNSEPRTIDAKSVDYWAITLNTGDSVRLETVLPEDQTVDPGIALRVWGPDHAELGPAVKGGEFKFVAPSAGTYTLGISTVDNIAYKLDPGSRATASGVNAHTFQAQFHVFAGSKTDTFGIFANYKNTEYTDKGWIPWDTEQEEAYQTFRKIAVAGAKKQGQSYVDARLENFTDFRHVGDIDTPSLFVGWLAATWEPFENLQRNRAISSVVTDTYAAFPVIQAAFENVDKFRPVADAFLHDQKVHDAYEHVHRTLADANAMRVDIASDFIDRYLKWSNSEQITFGDEPTDIFMLMKGGRTLVHETKPDPPSNVPWIERLLSSVVAISAMAGGAAFGPQAGIGINVVGNLVVNTIDAWLEGRFAAVHDKPKPLEEIDISGLVLEMKHNAQDNYKNAFDQLTNSKFLTQQIFSNQGLLEAMGTSRFTYSADDSTKPSAILRQGYDLAIWQELLPRMYSWKQIPFSDGSSTMPKFTNFIPIQETARWQSKYGYQPLGSWGNWDYYKHTFPKRDDATVQAEAKRQLTALQSGMKFRFPGYDFTPARGQKDFDWYGPGNISPGADITGKSGRFYAVATGAHLEQPNFWRGNNTTLNSGYYWWTKAETDGISIEEWALVTPDGKGGDIELSQAAADALFGSIPGTGLVPVDGKLKNYVGGQYLDFEVPEKGLVSRFDVFDSWGKTVAGFSPRNFRPKNNVSGSNVYYGLNDGNNNYFYHDKNNVFTWNGQFVGVFPTWEASDSYTDYTLSYKPAATARGQLVSNRTRP